MPRAGVSAPAWRLTQRGENAIMIAMTLADILRSSGPSLLMTVGLQGFAWHSFGIQWYGIPFGPTYGNMIGYRAHQHYVFQQVIDVSVISRLCGEAGDNAWSQGSSESGAGSMATNDGTKRRNEPSIGFLAQLRTRNSGLW